MNRLIVALFAAALFVLPVLPANALNLATINSNNDYISQRPAAPGPVPEPSTLLLLGIGFLGIAGIRMRVKKK